ncbi:hypothetical protein ACE8FZ_06685 [Peribacillus frigoritolerans]
MSERLTVLLAYLDALCKLQDSGVTVYGELKEVLADIKKEIKK